MPDRKLVEFLRGPLVIVTPRGVELPTGPHAAWDAIDITRYCGQIEALPETRHPLGASG